MRRRICVKGYVRRVASVISAAGFLVSSGCSAVGIRTTEEASYRVLDSEGKLELREYDEMVVVATTVEAGYEDAGNEGFRRLFRYISGNNTSKTKIAMTAPVFADAVTTSAGEDIAMTAPVMADERPEGWRYMFVLPASYSMETAPIPADSRVTLEAISKRKVAAIRYAGSRDEDAMRGKLNELRAWIEDMGLEAVSDFRSAGYDPPWTLPPLRRNEVLIDVK